MPVLVVPKNVVLSGVQVPELNDFVDFGTWSRFSASVRQAEESGNCIACAIEWGVCCVTGLWCVFCCHACIADGINSGRWRQECDNMNRVQYGSRAVFSIGPNNSVLVNTDNIGQLPQQFSAPGGYPAAGQPYSQPGYAQPAYAAASPQPAYAAAPPPPGQYYDNNAPPVMAAAVPMPSPHGQVQAPRYINVIVPPGVVPGSQLTISTPDNTSIQVTVPPGVLPGQEFKVQY